jgi:hypothetical protein
LKSDRTVWAWGDNFNGQLGDGTMTKHAEPIRVPGISDIVALDAGAMHSLALRSDGTVLTWGLNLDFQLGDNTRNIRTVPAQVPGLAGVAAVAGGDKHSIALKKDGSVWAWGANDQGQLGDGTTVGRFTPMQVPNISNVVAIAAGGLHNLAMTQDGSVWSWGANWSGQLGDGSTVSRAQPQRVGTLRDIRAVAAGSGHSVAIDRSGLAWAWGLDSGLVPDLIQDANNAVSVGAGAAHTLIVSSDGTVRSWGRNQFGQLGDGTLAQRRTPAMVLNDALTGSLDLSPSVPNSATGGTVPFFATVSSDSAIGSSTATVLTTIKFNEGDKGKSGSVYVTARVPAGALATGLADVPRAVSPLMAKVHESSAASSSLLASTGKPFELIQLTASGWKPVVNGQLVPYASGVLGDQLAAQTILNGTSIANLAGSEFCLGYGVNAAQMTSAEFVRSVATIPDGSNASNGNSCLPIALPSGWNLLGNSVSQSLPVSALFADASWVNSLWSWDPANSKWQFWSPGMSATELQNEIVNKGYSLLTSIGPGQGYWVHTSAPGAVLPPSGSAYNLNTALQPSGWSLLAAGVPTTPRELSNAIGNVMSIWAWDAALQKWLFYAPSLEAQGATVLKNYAETEGYRDFASSSKTLGPNVGFWLKK